MAAPVTVDAAAFPPPAERRAGVPGPDRDRTGTRDAEPPAHRRTSAERRPVGWAKRLTSSWGH
jgi:hypothetical protein